MADIDQDRIEVLRRFYIASVETGDLDARMPFNEAADQLAALHDSSKIFIEAISHLRAQARIEITRAGGSFDYEALVNDVTRMAAITGKARKAAERKRKPNPRGVKPDIARNVFLRGLHEIWRNAHGDGPLPYTSAGKAGTSRHHPNFDQLSQSETTFDAGGEFIDFLKEAVDKLPGFEEMSGEALRKAYDRAIKRLDK